MSPLIKWVRKCQENGKKVEGNNYFAIGSGKISAGSLSKAIFSSNDIATLGVLPKDAVEEEKKRVKLIILKTVRQQRYKIFRDVLLLLCDG
ncbi:hypothetical protein AV530_014134 [Patagioenas fasciata monilis]|uniref:Uncharacterized protein n=1 Tax=Patagioenas fasciata monilis TaxID=372326 RepID=A0A1V4KD71_PATFA|nr:hypothetical protein AV530_014134 [Patagioenas fasciata monilis]